MSDNDGFIMELVKDMRAERLMEFIKNFMEANHYAPTYTEMMAGVEEKSKKGIFDSLNRLESQGRIKRVPGKSRALRILNVYPVVESED